MASFHGLLKALALQAVASQQVQDDGSLLQHRSVSKGRGRTIEQPHGSHIKEHENCTGKSIWMWFGGREQKATDANTRYWVKQDGTQFSDGGTQVFYAAGRQTCQQFCSSYLDMVCVRGMDDAGAQSDYSHDGTSRCTLFPSGHNRQRQDEAGCRQKWTNQMCACGQASWLQQPSSFEDMSDQTCLSGDESNTILHKACDVAVASPNDPFGSSEKVHLLWHGQLGTSITTNNAGNLLISSAGQAWTTAEFAMESGSSHGRELVLGSKFRFYMMPMLQHGENFTYTDSQSGSDVTLASVPIAPIVFKQLPSFKASGNEMEIKISYTPDIFVNCLDKYTEIQDGYICEDNAASRVLRLFDQTLDQCWYRCASIPECKYFSHDAADNFCLGCTEAGIANHAATFSHYEVCKRSDLHGHCEQHDSVKCAARAVLQTFNEHDGVYNGWECRDKCLETDDCEFFAYNGKECQLCTEPALRQANFAWTVMSADCDHEVIAGKFSSMCTLEKACGHGKLLNSGFELWPGRDCSEALFDPNEWLCREGLHPSGMATSHDGFDPNERLIFFKRMCCYDAVEDPPEIPETCDLESVCGAGAVMQNPDYKLWGERTCATVLHNEKGWVCREQGGGVAYFKRKCCSNHAAITATSTPHSGQYNSEGKCVGKGCCLANACGVNKSVPPEHGNAIVWHGRSCNEIEAEESSMTAEGWMCDLHSAWGSCEGVALFKARCCNTSLD